METNHEFRKIPSLEFRYEISEDGRILRNIKSKQVLKPRLNQDYYEYVFCIKGKSVTKKTHTLVAECWLGPRPEGYVIDHIDRDKHNNHHSNLRYVTRHDNAMNVSDEEKERRRQSLAKGSYTRECMLEIYSEPVKWGDEVFKSKREMARELAKRFDKSENTIRGWLKQKRHYILGKQVSYECRDCML